jgi:hypothetical protein
MEGVLTLFLGLSIAVWVSSILVTILIATVGTVGPGILEEDRVVSMCLYMLLEILRALEGLATELASMWLQRDVDTDVGGDMVALHNSDATISPSTGQIQIVSTLATNMALADMVLLCVVSSSVVVMRIRWITHVELLRVRCSLAAANPLALEDTICAALKRWHTSRLLMLVWRLRSLRVLMVMPSRLDFLALRIHR